MKCIHCGTNSNYKTRSENGSRCSSCSNPFAFEPKGQRPKITDELFQKAIADVNGQGAFFFTRQNLLYALDRRLSKWKWSEWVGPLVPIGFFSVLAAVLVFGAVWPALPTIVVVGGVATGIMLSGLLVKEHRRRSERSPKFTPATFQELLTSWQTAHGPLVKLLEESASDSSGRRALDASLSAELREYSFARAVVTDKTLSAVLLVTNNFHLDNDCAVLSLEGYPCGSRETVLEMLRRNPGLRVMAVHDASAAGCELPFELHCEAWFPGESVKLINLGLRPWQGRAMGIPTIAQQQAGVGQAREFLAPDEVFWLESGKAIELAALPPAKLMRAINHAFARFDAMLQSQPDTPNRDSWIWFYNGGEDGDSADAAESFG